jgi:hypothetical protein
VVSGIVFSCIYDLICNVWTRENALLMGFALGGVSWTGSTTCASRSTCTYSSAYYSQCLPS